MNYLNATLESLVILVMHVYWDAIIQWAVFGGMRMAHALNRAL